MNKNYTNNQERLIYGLVLFFISPVIALYAAMKNFQYKESRWLIILFFGFFGLTMIIIDGKDSSTHRDYFVNYYIDKDFETFVYETKNILLLKPNLNEGRTNDDLYLHLISYLSSVFTSNPALLFFIASLIYSIFFIRGIGLVYEFVKGKWTFTLILIFFLFVIWKSFEGINSIRNWTGAWIFFNGAFSYFQTKNKKFLWLVLLAPMIHFGYFLITIPFFLIVLVGNHPKLYVFILIISFFISLENIDFIYEYLMITDLSSQKLNYIRLGSSEDYLIEGHANAFHAKYYKVAGKLAISIMFYYAILFFGYLKKENHSYLLMSLGSMGLLMIAFSNIVTFSVTINNRVFINGGLYILAYLVILYTIKIKKGLTLSMVNFNMVVYLCIPLTLLFAFTQFSNIGDFTNGKIFVSPLTYWIFEGDYSLKELFRELTN